ncbi:MAG: hemerythrin [Bdellovibrionales bacterium GWA2_49_15]|nr:MAG: hemerythrin [Bdellovibrionales bacterium GWA2_49_15]HAZ12632.1 hemerythrin [Bdellovibrionales bacterium]
MAIMEWKSELSVGIESIDNQHKELVAMIAELNDAMGKGKGREVLGTIFDKIIQYAGTHFAYEEKLFATHAFPGAAAHKVEHAALVKQALELQGKFKAGQMTISFATLDFLMDWLKKHIMGTDKQYTQFLVGKGVK